MSSPIKVFIKSCKELLLKISIILLALFVANSRASATSKPQLTTVSNIRSNYSATAEKLSFTWLASVNAKNYRINLLDSMGLLRHSVKTRSHSLKINASQLIDGENYTISIQAFAANHFKPSKIKTKKFKFSTRVSTKEFYGELKTTNSSGRNGTLFLPENYRLKSVPAILLFHGSTANGKTIAQALKSSAHKMGFIMIAPDSTNTLDWELSTDFINEPTADQIHVNNCLSELYSLRNISISKFLVAGHSAGAAMSAYFGSNDIRFGAFAVLHGGVFLNAVGNNYVPIWLSTGTNDTLRPPAELKSYQEKLPSFGFKDVTYNEYPIEHGLSEQEITDMLNWWQNK